jgi:predicted ester cyclase
VKKIYSIILILVILLGCSNSTNQTGRQNIQVIEIYANEIWNNRDFSLIDSIIGEDFVDPASVSGEKGPDGLKEVIMSYLEAYPDLKITVEEIVADKNKVAWKYIAVGTTKSTGEKKTFNGIIIDKIEKGKIVHRVGVWN